MYRLAQLSGLSKTTMIDIYSGKSNIAVCTLRTVWKLAQALGCTMENLMKEGACRTEDGRRVYFHKELIIIFKLKCWQNVVLKDFHGNNCNCQKVRI